MPNALSKKSPETLPLRIIVLDPPSDILWALQLGQEEIVKPTFQSRGRISFEFSVEVVEDASARGFRLRGPAVQGKAGKRFVYLRMGAYAVQAGERRDRFRIHVDRSDGRQLSGVVVWLYSWLSNVSRTAILRPSIDVFGSRADWLRKACVTYRAGSRRTWQAPLDIWMSRWDDKVDFDVHPVVTSQEAALRVVTSD